ncbi:MAG TPA: alkaline phosphatase family protein, partial [Solirubrobacteraceae bacterium]|nr:alkaline phosphatase family protein [Solirubrobacteraceae bacterium]
QGPTPQTAANCPLYSDIAPGGVGADGQVSGQGCVYPAATGTLPAQLAAKHRRWRAYVQGVGEGGSAPCAHPVLGQSDPSAGPSTPAYATWRNPVVYFHSLSDARACQQNDVGLSKLAADLASPKRTPSLSYIAPDRCHDGDANPCAPGAPAGLAASDPFLKRVVPEILASKAYKNGGLLAITVDQAPASGEFADSSSCCGQPQFPNLAASAPAGATHKGGGQVGALLLSPFIKGASTSQEPFNHFSLLRTIEDFFGLSHLGYAALSSVSSLPASVFSAYKG